MANLLQQYLDEIERQKDTYLLPENLKKDVSLLGVTGTLESGTTINNQDVTITPTTEEQTITADEGYTGIGTATVTAVDSTIDENIVSTNIKSGATILGVSGDSNVVDTSDGTITASKILEGYVGYSQGSSITGTYAPGMDETDYNSALAISKNILGMDAETNYSYYLIGNGAASTIWEYTYSPVLSPVISDITNYSITALTEVPDDTGTACSAPDISDLADLYKQLPYSLIYRIKYHYVGTSVYWIQDYWTWMFSDQPFTTDDIYITSERVNMSCKAGTNYAYVSRMIGNRVSGTYATISSYHDGKYDNKYTDFGNWSGLSESFNIKTFTCPDGYDCNIQVGYNSTSSDNSYANALYSNF